MTGSRKKRKIQTNEQHSAGGVAFRQNNGVTEIALILTVNEHRWQLPKGHIDPGETAEQAALREVREEAGIECELVMPITVIDYWFYHKNEKKLFRIHKFVHFFVMNYLSGNVEDHDDEVDEAKWTDINEAVQILFHDDEKNVVKKAALLHCGLEL